MDELSIPVVRPPRRLRVAAGAAAVLAALVCATIAARVLAVPPVRETFRYDAPRVCPTDWAWCAFLPMAHAPSVDDVAAALIAQALGEDPTPGGGLAVERALGPEWDWLASADDRAFVARATDLVARFPEPRLAHRPGGSVARLDELVGGPSAVVRAWLGGVPRPVADAVQADLLRYAALNAAGWKAATEAAQAEIDAHNRGFHEATIARERALADASRPRWWEGALVALALGAVGAAAAEWRQRGRRVRLGTHALSIGGRRWLWEELSAVAWRTDAVQILPREGPMREEVGLHLDAARVEALQELTDRLVRQRDGASDPRDPEALADLLRRAR